MRKHGFAVNTGFNALDRKLKGLQGADLVVMGGRPSAGKTAMAINIAAHVVLDAKAPVPTAFFSLEMSRNALMTRLIASKARVNLHETRNGFFRRARWSDLTSAAAGFSESPLYIDDSTALTVEEIRSRCRRLSKELRKEGKNLGLVIIDHLQLIADGRPRRPGQSRKRAAEVAWIMRQLKGLATALSTPVIVMSQLDRTVDGKEGCKPTLAEIRDLPVVEKADVVAFIYRGSLRAHTKDDSVEKADIIVAKNPRGATGSVALRFSKGLASFSE